LIDEGNTNVGPIGICGETDAVMVRVAELVNDSNRDILSDSLSDFEGEEVEETN
jgi:hypothetical protein